MLKSSAGLQIWSFHVAVSLETSNKYVKIIKERSSTTHRNHCFFLVKHSNVWCSLCCCRHYWLRKVPKIQPHQGALSNFLLAVTPKGYLAPICWMTSKVSWRDPGRNEVAPVFNSLPRSSREGILPFNLVPRVCLFPLEQGLPPLPLKRLHYKKMSSKHDTWPLAQWAKQSFFIRTRYSSQVL